MTFAKYSMSIFKNSCLFGKKTMLHKKKVLSRCTSEKCLWFSFCEASSQQCHSYTQSRKIRRLGRKNDKNGGICVIFLHFSLFFFCFFAKVCIFEAY